jgi:glycerol-3-phosphate responsive antiterminator
MNIYEITYVTYIFKNNKGKEVEKIKTILVEGMDDAEAERNFLTKDLKFRSIKSIKQSNSNTLGNMFPELIDLKKKLK